MVPTVLVLSIHRIRKKRTHCKLEEDPENDPFKNVKFRRGIFTVKLYMKAATACRSLEFNS
jgi:hypothetical protein